MTLKLALIENLYCIYLRMTIFNCNNNYSTVCKYKSIFL